MPITPCFDPTTGASGGASGGGGGVNLDAVPLGAAIDLTDGWTLVDPQGVVDTTYGTNGVTFSGGFNTVQFNAFGPGSNFNWGSTAAHEAPRWHKPLLINSVQMT